MKGRTLLAVLAVLLLYGLHNDIWNRAPKEGVLFGWFPLDIAYHVGWVVLAAFVLWLVMRAAWSFRS